MDVILQPIKIVVNAKIDFEWVVRNTDTKVPGFGKSDPIYVKTGDTLVYEIKY